MPKYERIGVNEEHERLRRWKYTATTIGVTHTLLCAGVVFGWTSLESVLLEEGVFSDYANPTLQFSSVFTFGAIGNVGGSSRDLVPFGEGSLGLTLVCKKAANCDFSHRLTLREPPLPPRPCLNFRRFVAACRLPRVGIQR